MTSGRIILEEVAFPGGQHCETTTLGALLRHEGLDLSESMLFGLGEGLGFVYWDAKNLDFPFLGGRTKPATITRTVAARLGLTLDVRETASPRKAWQNVTEALAAGRPAGLQLPLAASLMERGGTGGSLFRALYRDFLTECATLVGDDNLREGGRRYAEIAPLWTEVAGHLTTAGETGDHIHLTRASATLTQLAALERAAMQTLAAL
ncbi:BtrH N-terminal domain-containing protein [Catenuloplanes sp. NPDC051500]|uniref:BtrH N-terminal domain-containing protein n=1 Tax=Catenuloplanes sp. NPDC051500 TaxID=3363959 RepID=UPI0037BC375E